MSYWMVQGLRLKNSYPGPLKQREVQRLKSEFWMNAIFQNIFIVNRFSHSVKMSDVNYNWIS